MAILAKDTSWRNGSRLPSDASQETSPPVSPIKSEPRSCSLAKPSLITSHGTSLRKRDQFRQSG